MSSRRRMKSNSENDKQSGKRLKGESYFQVTGTEKHVDFTMIFKEVIGEEIGEIEQFVKYQHNQVLELSNKCHAYINLVKEKDKEFKFSQEQIGTLEKENLKLKESLSEYENTGLKKKDTNNEYIDRIRDLEAEKKSLQEKLRTEINQKSSLESKVIEKDERISNSRKQIDGLQIKCKEIEKAKSRENFAFLEKHKSRIQDLEVEREELTTNLNVKETTILEQNKTLNKLSSKLTENNEEEEKLKMEWADMLKEKNGEMENLSHLLKEEKRDKEFFKIKLCENEDNLKNRSLQMERMSKSVKDEILFFTEERKQMEVTLISLKVLNKQHETKNNNSEIKIKKMENKIQQLGKSLKDGNNEELNELKYKFRTLEDINKHLENKTEDAADVLDETKKEIDILNDSLKDIKEDHSRCPIEIDKMSQIVKDKDKDISGYLIHVKILEDNIKAKANETTNPQNNNLIIDTLKEELRKRKADYDILQSQKNIAVTKASIMESEVNNLEEKVTETESRLKIELENYKQNFNIAAMKTISVLKEEKKEIKTELAKTKADLDNLREATEKYKSTVDKYKLELFNAERSALESSISEHKEILESLIKMPEKYRRRTLKKLYQKSEEENLPGNNDKIDNSTKFITEPFDMEKSIDEKDEKPIRDAFMQKPLDESNAVAETKQLDDPMTILSSLPPSSKVTQSSSSTSDINIAIEKPMKSKKKTLKDLKKPKVKESLVFSAFLDHQQNPVKKSKVKSKQSVENNKLRKLSENSFNPNLGFERNSFAPPYSIPKTSNKIVNIPSNLTVLPQKVTDQIEQNFQKKTEVPRNSLLDSIDRFTNLTKEKVQESERKVQESEKKVISLQQYKEVKKNVEPIEDPFEIEVKQAVSKTIFNLEREGFFRDSKIQMGSTEKKFFSYFLRKFKGSTSTNERRIFEIEQTLKMYAVKTRDKINKNKQ